MYLGSRPAVSVARWSTRPDLSVPGFGLPDSNAGWPIHYGQSNKFKYHHHAAVASPMFRGGDDLRRLENAKSPFVQTSRSLMEFQNWPKSEFELVAEAEEGDNTDVKNLFVTCDSSSSLVLCPSEWSLSDETVLIGSSLRSKSGSLEETQTVVERTKSDGWSMCDGEGGGGELQASSPGRDSKSVRLGEGPDFLETELVYNRHAHEMKLALPPSRSMNSGRPSRAQTGPQSVCRPSACRKRVHPVGKFTDELVNWMPQNGTTDDERGEDDDNNDVEFEHCNKNDVPSCNGSHNVHVSVRHIQKRTTNISKHHSKRKRTQIAADGKDRTGGGIHRRRKQHNPWSIEETQMLIKGVSICGEGHWADIKRLEFSELASRSPVDLKDKWRNLLRLAQFSHVHSRNKKVGTPNPASLCGR